MGTEQPVKARPLSPHLQIYKPMLSMMMSIFHRLTGMGLYFAVAILIWWLMAAASGPVYFNWVSDLLATWPAKFILILGTWAFFHHMIGGIRHFIWDSLAGFKLWQIEAMAKVNVILPPLFTAALWLML